MLMPQDMRECIRKTPWSVHCRRQLTDPLSQSLRLFNVWRGRTINVINGYSSRQNRIFQRREKGSWGAFYRSWATLFNPIPFKNIGSEVEIKAGKLARGTNVYSVTKMFPRKEKEVCSTAFL